MTYGSKRGQLDGFFPDAWYTHKVNIFEVLLVGSEHIGMILVRRGVFWVKWPFALSIGQGDTAGDVYLQLCAGHRRYSTLSTHPCSAKSTPKITLNPWAARLSRYNLTSCSSSRWKISHAVSACQKNGSSCNERALATGRSRGMALGEARLTLGPEIRYLPSGWTLISSDVDFASCS